MALFQKEEKAAKQDDARSTANAAPAAPPVAPATPPPGTNPKDFQAVLGQGSRIEGQLSFDGNVRIDGHVEGEITAKETVLVGEGAVVAAQVQASTVIILGQVRGDVTARKRVELRAPGRLIGNLNTPGLVIHEGVTFEGHCTMGGAQSQGEKKVAIFPTEERAPKDEHSNVPRVPKEAAKTEAAK
jgi:cytoskeletal protein CcmA (bactofilin family)